MKKMIIVVLKSLALIFAGFLVGWKIGKAKGLDECKLESYKAGLEDGWDDGERWAKCHFDRQCMICKS